jgi:hypothetical protein
MRAVLHGMDGATCARPQSPAFFVASDGRCPRSRDSFRPSSPNRWERS